MDKRLLNIVENYDKEKISLDDLIYGLKLYHRKRVKTKTKHLIKELHPVLREAFTDFIKEVETQTSFVYYGIYDGLEGRGKGDLKHYHIKFQHRYYFDVTIDISYGTAGSCNNVYSVRDDGKVHIGACDGSASFVYGAFPIDGENLRENIIGRIISFDEQFNE
jgi:hypothetical protein